MVYVDIGVGSGIKADIGIAIIYTWKCRIL